MGLVCPRCDYVGEHAKAGDLCPVDGTALLEPGLKEKHPRDKFLGRVVADKYAIVGVVGVGGFGAVYRAIQAPVGRPVALKVIQSSDLDAEDMRARFFREAKAVSRLSHPSVVTLFDYGQEQDGLLYMVFELVDGENLAQVLEREGPMRPKRAVDLMCQILGALSEAHQENMIHRDLKPGNVMVLRGPWGEEHAKVLDFGIAKVRGSGDGAVTVATRKGLILGTPWYMSPEQASTSLELDGRSDLYSLSVVLYELLSGHPPFQSGSAFDVLRQHADTPVRPLLEALPIEEPLRMVLEKGLAKRPDERYTSAASMAKALRAACPESAVPVTPPGTVPEGLPMVADALLEDMRQRKAAGQPASGRLTAAERPSARRDTMASGIMGEAVPTSEVGRSPSRLLPLLVGLVVVGMLGGGGLWYFVERGPQAERGRAAASGDPLATVVVGLEHSADAGGGNAKGEPVPLPKDAFERAMYWAREGNSAKAGDALVEAIDAAGDPRTVIASARKLPTLRKLLRDPVVEALIEQRLAKVTPRRAHPRRALSHRPPRAAPKPPETPRGETPKPEPKPEPKSSVTVEEF